MYKKLFSLSKILLAHNFHTRWNIKHKHEDYGNTCNGVFKGGIQHLKGTYLVMILAVNNLESSHHASVIRGIHMKLAIPFV